MDADARAMSAPDMDDCIRELKGRPGSAAIGMILAHNGIVRGTTRSGVPVTGMYLTADLTRFEEALAEARTWPGIFAVRGWVNEGELSVGDDIMRLVVAGDIREHVFEGLQRLVCLVKKKVVGEYERA
jgi:molybdopterin synthase catalytic subunit